MTWRRRLGASSEGFASSAEVSALGKLCGRRRSGCTSAKGSARTAVVARIAPAANAATTAEFQKRTILSCDITPPQSLNLEALFSSEISEMLAADDWPPI